VGESIARNAWPARVARDGTLHVHTSSSAWAFELAQLEQTLLERLQAAVGEAVPRKLRFVVGNIPERPCEPISHTTTPPPTPSADDVAEAESLTVQIGDEELRNLVQRAAAASLARARSDRPF
jgi:hypothetical protein